MPTDRDAPTAPPLPLVLVAAITGMAAILAFPLVVGLRDDAPLIALLVLAMPITLVVVGGATSRPWLLRVGLLAVVVALAAVAEVPVLRGLGVPMLIFGPIVVVVLLGPLLRELDLVAAAGFLLTGTIVVIAGLATVEQAAMPIVVLTAAAIGLVVVAVRLRTAARREPV